jgi:hypothetical protein
VNVIQGFQQVGSLDCDTHGSLSAWMKHGRTGWKTVAAALDSAESPVPFRPDWTANVAVHGSKSKRSG